MKKGRAVSCCFYLAVAVKVSHFPSPGHRPRRSWQNKNAKCPVRRIYQHNYIFNGPLNRKMEKPHCKIKPWRKNCRKWGKPA